MSSQSLLVIGHRGAAGEAPENTLVSFALAAEQQAGGIELDVHLSKDGQIIVCHDTTIDRTTTGTGNIADLTLEELKQVDAGVKYNEKFAGEKLPTLEEVVDLLPSHMQINVEIKSDSLELRNALIELLHRRNLLDRVFVSSFHLSCLVLLKQAEPRVKIGFLYHKEPFSPAEAKAKFDVELYSLHPHHSHVNRAYVEEAEKLGLKVYPWTVNTEERMKQLIEDGVSGIITDFPRVLHSLVAK
jgi:glycerophosphoryl diester phosphodiesterase